MNDDYGARFMCQSLEDQIRDIIPLLDYTPEELKQERFLSKIKVINIRLTFIFIFNFVDYPEVDALSFLTNLQTMRINERYEFIFTQQRVSSSPVHMLFAPLEFSVQFYGIEAQLRMKDLSFPER